jgi:hypothetical protein
VNVDHLLTETCTWYALNGQSQDANLEPTTSYAAGVELACNPDQPSARWTTKWPGAKLGGSIVLNLPSTATDVKAQDKITYRSQDYRVMDVAIWPGTAVDALCERIAGVT